MSVPDGIVINTDVEFAVFSDGKKFGEVHLSRGTIDWHPAHSKKVEYSHTWEDFARRMTD
jgi:hypothetical protein